MVPCCVETFGHHLTRRPIINQLRSLSLIILTLWLAACGRPDSGAVPLSTIQPNGPTVEQLVRNPPSAQQKIEITAYAVKIGNGRITERPNMCPVYGPILTDIPIPASSRALNGILSTHPEHIPALIAVSQEELPHHGRFAGHFGDERFAACMNAAQIFVVDAVLQVFEQNPPDYLQIPDEVAGTDTWQRYRDDARGFSFAYPPDWLIEPTKDDQGLPIITLRSPQFRQYPIQLHIVKGETYLDSHDVEHSPPLVRGGSPLQQTNIDGARRVASQGMWPIIVGQLHEGSRLAAVFTGGGYTYDFSLTYSYLTPQPVLDTLAVMVAGFRLDKPPQPTPITVAQTIDQSRTYLNKDAAIGRVQQLLQPNFPDSDMEIVRAQLISERESLAIQNCLYQGHPGALWDIAIRGQRDGYWLPVRIVLHGASGEMLCIDSSPPETVDGKPFTPEIPTEIVPDPSTALTPGITPVVTPEPISTSAQPIQDGIPTPTIAVPAAP